MTKAKQYHIKAAVYAKAIDNITIQFAIDELHTHLDPFGFEIFTLKENTPEKITSKKSAAVAGSTPDWIIYLTPDINLPAGTFNVECTQRDEYLQIILSAPEPSGLMSALYTLLERIGFVFEITGPRRPDVLKLERLKGFHTRIKPAVTRRGIRQHLNFPMDISSYPIDEAREYIRNLARLRLNHITFHSYPEQWYTATLAGGRTLQAGSFFYGQRHDVPDYPVVKKAVRNEKTFCIPAIEPVFDNPTERSFRAIEWLNALMSEAKRAGFTIQFSFELRGQTAADLDLTASLDTCDAILNSYSNIDVLEMITQETGGWEDTEPLANLQEALLKYFPSEVMEEKQVKKYLVEGQPGLARLVREIGHAIEVAKNLNKRPAARKIDRLCLGVYCVIKDYLPLCFYLLRQYAPGDMDFSVLPQHGGRAVHETMAEIDLFDFDKERALFYSWLEFDGIMYLQQNGIEGIHRLIKLEQQRFGTQPVNGIAFNHWRTAENRTVARYAALALLQGAFNIENFYREYAGSLNIGNTAAYIQAMTVLDDADTAARDTLWNVGFCAVGCWGTSGLGYFGGWDPAVAAGVRQKYSDVLADLQICIQSTKNEEGLKYLTFLANRVECTILYLRAIEKALELQPICKGKTPADLTKKEQKKVCEICDQSLALIDQVMVHHAERIEDRGCEGTLISFYYTPPAVLQRIRKEYGGKATRDIAISKGADTPPSPMQ